MRPTAFFGGGLLMTRRFSGAAPRRSALFGGTSLSNAQAGGADDKKRAEATRLRLVCARQVDGAAQGASRFFWWNRFSRRAPLRRQRKTLLFQDNA